MRKKSQTPILSKFSFSKSARTSGFKVYTSKCRVSTKGFPKISRHIRGLFKAFPRFLVTDGICGTIILSWITSPSISHHILKKGRGNTENYRKYNNLLHLSINFVFITLPKLVYKTMTLPHWLRPIKLREIPSGIPQ